MDVLVDYQGNWGLGDLLCSDPMILGLVERHGRDTRVFLRGKSGNVAHNPLVAGTAREGQRFDRVVEVKLFTHMPITDYAKLEAMPSLIEHMCSYANVKPSDPRPKLHLGRDDLRFVDTLRLPPRRPRIVICADHVDPLRHWPVDRWQQVANVLAGAGAVVIGIGQKDHLAVDGCIDLTGKLSMRETAAVMTQCDLFVGNNSGPFHYAQAAGLPCVTLFSLALPTRFIHPAARVHVVEATGLPCLHCMSRCFASMVKTGCIASPRGRCMTDIPVEEVLEACDLVLRTNAAMAAP